MTVKKQVINPEAWGAPFPGFSQAYVVDLDDCRIVSISGQVAFDGDEIVGVSDLEQQVERCWERIREIVEAAGGQMSDLIETRTYMLDITQLPVLARVRARFLADPPPTSTAVQVSGLAAPEALVEVEAKAVIAR
jgi:enamine deaminase RidA (YjgF/YER057c/UK114 family)